MRSLIFVLLMIVTAIAHASNLPSGKSAFSRNTALPKWADVLDAVPATTSTEPVVLRLAEVQYWAGAKPAYLVNRAVQVNSTARISELGQFSVSFAPAYQKLVMHRIAILRGDQVLDRTSSANIRVLDSERDAGQGYYTGLSTVQVLLEDVKAGDTLWTIYTVEGSNPVFGAMWNEQLPWTKELPIELRKAVVLYPSQKTVQWRISGAARPGLATPAIDQRNGITRMVFRERAVAAEEFEPSLPPSLVPFPLLDFTEYRDWAAVAQWANKLFPNVAATPEMRKLAQKFASGPEEERASEALHWVQDEIRYFSVSVGENSHRPQLPEVVLKKRFGDCKDKTLLLVALYRIMGLQAHPVLVNSGAPKLPAQFLPSPGNFNHVIVRVELGGKQYFVDPTLQDERGLISSLAAPVPSASALVVSNDATGLIELPEDLIELPLIDRTERIDIPQLRGEGQLQLNIEYRGRLAVAMRQFYRSLSSSDLKKMVLGQYERTYGDVRMDGLPKLSDANGGASFVIAAEMTVPKMLKEENGSFLLAQRTHVLEGTLGIPEKVVRKYPFWISAGRYRTRYTLDASLPSEARMMKSDDRVEVKNDFFAANGQLTWRGAHLRYHIDYAINKPEVAPADMAGLVQEAEKLTPLIESKLRFKPVTVPPEAAKAASLRVLDILEKIYSFEDIQIEALKTGKIPELKFDESTYAKLNYRALCELMIDTYTVRDWNPLVSAPVAAIYKMIEARADKRTKDLCMARAEIVDRNLAFSSKSLAALAPPDDDSLTLMQAWSDFHAKSPSVSRANLARFLKAGAKSGTVSVDEALLAAALARRLGDQEPAEVIQVAQSLRANSWPAPLFDLLRGKLSPDDALAAVERLPAAAREHASLEARFAIAQQYLAGEQKEPAQSHLNWLNRHGILGSPFAVLADADKYGEARADSDMQEVWTLERSGKSRSAIEHLTAAAAKGIAIAQSKLGSRYMEGDGVRLDLAKAEQLLAAAAAKGDSNALHDLGLIYLSGKPGFDDKARAVEYFRKSADQGNAYGGFSLGRVYWFGQYGMPIDFEQAYQYMKIGAEQGHTEAQFFLSRMYHEGKGVERNDSLAKFWATQSHIRKKPIGTAQLGLLLFRLEPDDAVRVTGMQMLVAKANENLCYAQQELGKILLGGKGFEADLPAAANWIKSASECGFDESSALLARLYVEGQGIAPNVSKGMKMLADQASENSPYALYELGEIHRLGLGQPADKLKAADFLRKATERGHREAAEKLAYMLHVGDGIQQDKVKAVQYYEIAIKSGLTHSLNNLANIYAHGDGMPKDEAKAMALYRRAGQGGHSTAMLSLGEMYESSKAGKENTTLPLAYFMLAARLGQDEAKAGVERLKAKADQATVEKLQAYVAAWKPGKAMPEEI